MAEGSEWIRARGLGRERMASYLAEYLTGLGYTVERTDSTEPAASVVAGELKRMNPAVPPVMARLRVRFLPTSGGAAAHWESPREIPTAQRSSADRFLREMTLHLERTVQTESHGTAKVQAPLSGRLPWDSAETGPSRTAGTRPEAAL
ncbi:MAG: hypothetical protein ACYDFT_01650 [Thermoplasmata archaeon]